MNPLVACLWHVSMAVRVLCLVLLFRRRLAGRYWELTTMLSVGLVRSVWLRAVLWTWAQMEYDRHWIRTEPVMVIVYALVALVAFRRLAQYYRVGRWGVLMAVVFLAISAAIVLSIVWTGALGVAAAPRVEWLSRQYVGICFTFVLLSTRFLGAFRMTVPPNVSRHMRTLQIYLFAQVAGLGLSNLGYRDAGGLLLVGLTAVAHTFWCIGLVPEGERYKEEPRITEDEFDRLLEPGQRLSQELARLRKASRG